MDIIGKIAAPSPVANIGDVDTGLGALLDMVIKTIVVGAALYALVNLLLAGYAFMSAGDDPKKVQGAWAKIYQTLLGLAFTAGAFVLAAIFGQLIFQDPTFLLKPTIPTL
jgi:hypothetical protein